LRAINLGSVNKISMPALRTMFEDLGHQNVRTYVQSGNVVFAAGGKAADLERDLERAAVRRREQLRLAVRAALPHRSDRVDHPLGRQLVPRRGPGVAGVTTTEITARRHQLGASGPVDGSVDPAATA
jgi:hypothetical protein